MGFEPPTGMPTVFDPSYKGVGKKVGIEMWRVEKLAVVKKPPTDDCYSGKLYSGDSYIVLHSKAKGNAIVHDIHFWIGKDSSQDEYGVAAYKTVELDESLGGEPVQHREVQGHESDEFLKMFKNGVRYEEGGVATGFKHVDRENFETRLLHIKGRRNIRVQGVPIELKSLNKGDVFILDAGRKIFQWNGSESSRVEKQKGLEITKKIRDEERSGEADIVIIDEGSDDDAEFWKTMGCKKAYVKSAKEAGSDEDYSRKQAEGIKLYKVSDAGGSLKTEEIKTKPLKKEMLDTNDAFILDNNGSALYAWIGKGASPNEKLHAMKGATDFLKSKGYPNHTPVTRVVEGGETPLFKQCFNAWPEANPWAPKAAKAKKAVAKFDPKSMHAKQERVKARLPDDGTGKIQIWRIEDFERAEWPADKYGHFYSGDSYVILYTYLKNDKECYIVYFWQGLKSTQDEVGASALWAKNVDDELGGAAVQVRVVENKEPPHFYLMFKGKMIVHDGGRASGFKNRDAQDSYDNDGTKLFQIRGQTDYDTRAIQVDERAASLNSGDAFLLKTPKNLWLWIGGGCSGDEREMAKTVAKTIGGKDAEMVAEKQESKEFWDALGGKAEYANSKAALEDDIRDARLFQCSNVTGTFLVEEIHDFDQEDLIENDVMILDTYYEVYVWIGKGALDEEKKKALETAIEYVKTDPSGRKEEDTCFIVLKQGIEPPNFTCHFSDWDEDLWSNGMTYEEMKKSLAAGGSLTSSVSAELKKYSTDNVYTLAQLTADPIPEGVNPTKKEQYLSDADFKEMFKMTKAEFNKLPKWKANGLKKKTPLY